MENVLKTYTALQEDWDEDESFELMGEDSFMPELMLTADLRMDVTVDPCDPDEGALKVLKVIRPHWNPQDIVRKPIGENEGTVNLLFRYVNTRFDDVIVMRIFGEGLDKYMNREEEIKTYRLLSDYKAGPDLYAIFNNGFFCTFVKGSTYSLDEGDHRREDINLAKAAAREAAIYHSKDIAKRAVETYEMKTNVRIHDMWREFMDDWGEWMYDIFPILKCENFPSKECLDKEIEMTKRLIADFHLPLVYCHNDLHAGNVIYDVEKDQAILIDIEFGCFHYAGFDLAFYLFYSAFGLGLNPSDEPPPLHPPEYVRTFLKEYLEALSKRDRWGRDVTDEDLETIQKQHDIFLLQVLLVHIPVYLMIAAKPTVEGTDCQGIARGCVKAWKLYLRKRQEILGY